MNLIELYCKLEAARESERLEKDLFQCIRMHHKRSEQEMEVERLTGICPCDGCKFRETIEAAMNVLDGR